jgi:hypothetical protein
MSYDEKCYILADEFLSDVEWAGFNSDDRRDRLAKQIQDTIEGFIATERDNYEPPDVPGWEGGFAENH